MALAAAQGSNPESGAIDTPPESGNPAKTWQRLLASTALAMLAGVGAGIWLGKTPSAGSFAMLSASQDRVFLRLDDILPSVAAPVPRVVPRD